MNKNRTKNRHLISRFSSSLLGRGKKTEAHKILFNCLLILRSNIEKKSLNLILQNHMLKNWSDNNVILFLFSVGYSQKILQNFINRNKYHFIRKESARSQKNERSFVAQHIESDLLPFSTKDNKQQFSLTIDDIFGTSSRAIQNADAMHIQNEFCRVQGKQQNEQDILLRNSGLPKASALCKKSVNNVKPILESRKVRKGRVTHRVPLVTQTGRQEGKAISWIIDSACPKKNKAKFVSKNVSLTKDKLNDSLSSKVSDDKKKMFRSLKYCLSEQFLDAFHGKGESVEKRKEFHQLALQNRAYTHYRWW